MESTKVILPSCIIPPLPTQASQSEGPRPSGATPKPCPWGKVTSTESVSLNDVMSEQLALSLQKGEDVLEQSSVVDNAAVFATDVNDCCDDFMVAKMLQLEFDKEHDELVKQEERKLNRSSKVSVSFDKYLRLPDVSFSSDDEEEADDAPEQSEKRHWQSFDQAEKAFQAVGKSGVSKQGNTTTTKHDLAVCGRRNACKLMAFPSEMATGDGGGFDFKISNSVYNTLKSHNKAETRRRQKFHDKKEKATIEKALDAKSILILYKMKNNEMLGTVNGCFSTGKEACVYHAFCGNETIKNSSEKECAIKIYTVSSNDFQNRDQYIKDDHRFHDRYTKLNHRKIIHLWAEKEMRNLMRITKANIPCPKVISLKKNVLIMSFIGSNTVPAPKLRDIKLPFEEMTDVYEQTLDIMKKLYTLCNLVHSDLSEYNLLWYKEKVWVIDVSQAVEITHPLSLQFLMRDCHNICNFFQKRGVLNIINPETLFTKISGHVYKS